MDLKRIRFIGKVPFEAYFKKAEDYTKANKQADLFYLMSNGDTMKVSVCEFETMASAQALFYNSNIITKQNEFLIGNNRMRFLIHGRRIFIFSYKNSIPSNTAVLDSLVKFTQRFPEKNINSELYRFSLKNTDADNGISVQRDYFLGIEAPFNMIVREYNDNNFTWFCAHSESSVPEDVWNTYIKKLQSSYYEADKDALISRFSNGTIIAVYGNLNKKQMQNVFDEFKSLQRF